MKKYFAILLLFPTILMGKQEYIKLSDQVSNPFVKEYSRRARLSLIGFGGGMVHDIDLICMTFIGHQRLDIPAVRRLYVGGAEDLLNRYNCDKKVRPYLHNFPFAINNLEFHIIFEDPSGEFVPSNFIASVFFVKGFLCYTHTHPESGELTILYEEPYDEAVRMVHAEREQAKNSEPVSPDSRDLPPQRVGSANRRVSK